MNDLTQMCQELSNSPAVDGTLEQRVNELMQMVQMGVTFD